MVNPGDMHFAFFNITQRVVSQYPPSGPKLPGHGEQGGSHMQHALHVAEQDGLLLMSPQAP